MQITKHIHQLTVPFQIPIAPGKTIDRFVNLFILTGEKVHLIDSGVSAAFPLLEIYLESIGRSLSETENLLLTHSHPDHIGSAKIIAEKTNCRIFAHSAELKMIEDTAFQFSVRPVPGFHQLVAGSAKVDCTVADGNVIHLEENLTIRVIHTPGHSAGSVSFYLEEEKAIFTGDAVLLPGELPVFEDVPAYLQSLDQIEKQQATVLFSAWDQPKQDGEISLLMNASRTYISRIQQISQKTAELTTDREMVFCREVTSGLGLPAVVANPLLLSSYLACL